MIAVNEDKTHNSVFHIVNPWRKLVFDMADFVRVNGIDKLSKYVLFFFESHAWHIYFAIWYQIGPYDLWSQKNKENIFCQLN